MKEGERQESRFVVMVVIPFLPPSLPSSFLRLVEPDWRGATQAFGMTEAETSSFLSAAAATAAASSSSGSSTKGMYQME